MPALRISLDVPPGFTGLPLTDSPAGNTARLNELAGRIAVTTGESPARLAEYLTSIVSWMAVTDVRLFGKFAVGDEEPALATLALGIMPLTSSGDTVSGNRDLLVGGLAAKYREHRPDADVRAISLSSGPALAALVTGEFRLPPEVSGQAHEVVKPVFRAEFQIPAVDGKSLIVLSITADSAANWPGIAEQAVAIANSIRIEWAKHAAVS